MTDESEFPPFTADSKGIVIDPEEIEWDGDDWKCELKLQNNDTKPILFKVKATNNKRCKITNCADILSPGESATVTLSSAGMQPKPTDKLLIVYGLYNIPENVEKNAFLAWQRAKSRDVVMKTVYVALRGKADK